MGNQHPLIAMSRHGLNSPSHQQCRRAREMDGNGWQNRPGATDNKTDLELIYWIPKYILMRNHKQFAQLGHMLQRMCTLAENQDNIGWRTFT
jgi:hypothetical protein